MPTYVPDTHSLIWRAMNSSRLGEQANAVFNLVDRGAVSLVAPIITVAELFFTIERRRLPLDFQQLLHLWRRNPVIEIAPLITDVIALMETATAVPEMHDRLIVCEALLRNATVITRDVEIIASGLAPTIW